MKHAFISFLLMMGTIQAQAQDQDFWIFLCYGQSNMAGQAPIEHEDLTVFLSSTKIRMPLLLPKRSVTG